MRSSCFYAGAITNTQFDSIPTSAPIRLWRASQLSASSALLKIIGTSVPKSREAGNCETRWRRVGALRCPEVGAAHFGLLLLATFVATFRTSDLSHNSRTLL
ncbi:hypothetical protein Y032_0714g1762 [Ancylostoma ceylanicum]|uniref:Uncharacterized protein n=1 Tax=Ancylostoma ceylanicum TaxID=53326 RepID=A0A016WFW2_9BILA|nr:hypothetical protein Y032_0714g1762 [Ancylostoma ceylanicum]